MLLNDTESPSDTDDMSSESLPFSAATGSCIFEVNANDARFSMRSACPLIIELRRFSVARSKSTPVLASGFALPFRPFCSSLFLSRLRPFRISNLNPPVGVAFTAGAVDWLSLSTAFFALFNFDLEKLAMSPKSPAAAGASLDSSTVGTDVATVGADAGGGGGGGGS